MKKNSKQCRKASWRALREAKAECNAKGAAYADAEATYKVRRAESEAADANFKDAWMVCLNAHTADARMRRSD